jgi:hypothetical protein
MRKYAPINHFPPTLFSPNGSPIYEEMYLFSQPASRLVTGNPSLQIQEYDLSDRGAGVGPMTYSGAPDALPANGFSVGDLCTQSQRGWPRPAGVYSAPKEISKKMFETH